MQNQSSKQLLIFTFTACTCWACSCITSKITHSWAFPSPGSWWRQPGHGGRRQPGGRVVTQQSWWGTGGPLPSCASSPGCLLQIGEGKSKSGFSLGPLIFITSEFGDTGSGIWFSLEEACWAVQWVGVICWHCGPFTHGPELPYSLFMLYHPCGSSQHFFFQKMQEAFYNDLSWRKLLLCYQ